TSPGHVSRRLFARKAAGSAGSSDQSGNGTATNPPHARKQPLAPPDNPGDPRRYRSMIPLRPATVTAWVRSATINLANMLLRWPLIDYSDSPRSEATCLLA